MFYFDEYQTAQGVVNLLNFKFVFLSKLPHLFFSIASVSSYSFETCLCNIVDLYANCSTCSINFNTYAQNVAKKYVMVHFMD